MDPAPTSPAAPVGASDDPPPLHRQLGMTDAELEAVVELLGRKPNHLELAMYSVMWSEHCSYKSSSRHLRRFPTEAPWVLVGPGEGAGVVDVGHGGAVAVRIESHNHPSAVEPHQGAATGVGGIIRDVFSMGARPIALLDPLRFGPLDVPRNRYLLEGVVAGISSYGNAVGVPTVGGETVFDPCYSGNPLVNVMCLGVLETERLVLARAGGPGNLAVLLGASTGRDGIGGASVLASAGLDDRSGAKRPSVQVGDPFEEKKLIEACLELVGRELVVGVQDLGAAGLSCAASETAAKAGAGMDVDVARVARREPGMDPVEVMISESQERMLAVVEPARLDDVLAVARRHEVRAMVVGRVTGSGRFRVWDGLLDAEGVPGEAPPPPPGEAPRDPGAAPELLADVPADSLGEGPSYDRPLHRPSGHDAALADDPWRRLAPRYADAGAGTLEAELLALLATPTIADASWIWSQYDHQLFLNTVAGPGGGAAVLRLKDLPGPPRALAVSTDGKARFCRLDPRTGGRLVVIEAVRNVVCTGARPLALVNCLNFGNPEHPEVMWQFSEVVDGMSEACAALDVPVIGGNVSFYNESRGVDIDPTPVAGVIGLLEPLTGPPPPARLLPGRVLVLLGATAAELGGSEWAVLRGATDGTPPAADLDTAAALHGLVLDLVGRGVVDGIQDCADGGLAVTLAELAIRGGVGAVVDLAGAPDLAALPPAVALFSESTSRVVLVVDPGAVRTVLDTAAASGVPAARIGTVGAPGPVSALVVRDGTGRTALDVEVAALADAWRGAIPRLLEAAVPTPT